MYKVSSYYSSSCPHNLIIMLMRILNSNTWSMQHIHLNEGGKSKMMWNSTCIARSLVFLNSSTSLCVTPGGKSEAKSFAMLCITEQTQKNTLLLIIRQ